MKAMKMLKQKGNNNIYTKDCYSEKGQYSMNVKEVRRQISEDGKKKEDI